MTIKTDELAEVIDSLDSVAHALSLPMPAQMHVDILRTVLPEKVLALKAAFIALTGDNPWETHP
jgi:hypothetical protein